MLRLGSEILETLSGSFGQVAIQSDPKLRRLIRSEQRARFREKLWWLVIGLCATLASMIWLVIGIASHTMTPATAIEIAPYLLPGNPKPNSASCNFGDPFSRYLIDCKAIQNGTGEVYFSYDKRKGIIDSASTLILANEVAIGDLIVAWGQPNDYTVEQGNIQIFWDAKSAYLAAPLHPSSLVKVIRYCLDCSNPPLIRLVWRGFVHIEEKAETEQQ